MQLVSHLGLQLDGTYVVNADIHITEDGRLLAPEQQSWSVVPKILTDTSIPVIPDPDNPQAVRHAYAHLRDCLPYDTFMGAVFAAGNTSFVKDSKTEATMLTFVSACSI